MTLTSKTFADLITFTRSGATATRVNSAGLIESVAADTPRFDHDPVTLEAKGLLIEESRTNLCLYSDDFTNAAWTKTNCTAAMTATGPDGVANSASTLTATAGNATALQAITSASAARVTSCWVKRRTGSGAIEMTQDNGGAWNAVTVTAAWTRVEIAAATLTNPNVGLRIVTSGDAVDVALFQHEVGSFVTSAIPTTTATVTRNADNASITGTDFSDWYSATEGTIYVELETNGAVDNAYILSISDGSLDNVIGLRHISSGPSLDAFSFAGASLTVDMVGQGFSYGASTKLALAFATNDFALAVAGQATETDASATVPTVNQLQIGGGPTFGSFTGHIKALRFYPSRLSNAELQEITS